jgi:hypothetical protein
MLSASFFAAGKTALANFISPLLLHTTVAKTLLFNIQLLKSTSKISQYLENFWTDIKTLSVQWSPISGFFISLIFK